MSMVIPFQIPVVGRTPGRRLGALQARCSRPRSSTAGSTCSASFSSASGGTRRWPPARPAARHPSHGDPKQLVPARRRGSAARHDPRARHLARHAIIDTLDAVVIGLFGAIGTSKALALGVPAVPAIAIGVLAAVGGSIFRDVSMGLPVAFLHVGSFYALAAGAGTTLLFALVAGESTCRSRPQPGSRSPPQCGSRRFDSAGRCPSNAGSTPATSAPTSDGAGAEAGADSDADRSHLLHCVSATRRSGA